MSNIIPFSFEESAVRVIDGEGGLWFVLADVCAVLDISNVGNAAARLDNDEKGVHSMDTLGGKQDVTIINESGLYSLILTSRKPSAKRFKKWVTSEVLPSIRKTGQYNAAPQFAIPQTLKEALRLAADSIERAEAAEATVNRLASCPDMMGIQEAAKALKVAPKAFGKMLREWGWVYDRRGTKRSKVLAYQNIIDKGWMIHDAVELDDGSIKYHPKITGEGMVQAAKRLDS